jgi:hypothetical protein
MDLLAQPDGRPDDEHKPHQSEGQVLDGYRRQGCECLLQEHPRVLLPQGSRPRGPHPICEHLSI